MNKIQLVGWLGEQPEIITTKEGSLVLRMQLATDHFVARPGETPVKYTAWHTIKLWNQVEIEFLRNYLTKGSHVFVEGRIEYRQFRDKLGIIRTVAEIMTNHLVDLDR